MLGKNYSGSNSHVCSGILPTLFYVSSLRWPADSKTKQQTRIITPIPKPSSIISSETRAFVLMISGHWSLIRLSSCNMFALWLSLSAVSSVSSRVA